jgi:hypothetical protein
MWSCDAMYSESSWESLLVRKCITQSRDVVNRHGLLRSAFRLNTEGSELLPCGVTDTPQTSRSRGTFSNVPEEPALFILHLDDVGNNAQEYADES